MPSSDTNQALFDSAAEVLETMFFTSLSEDAVSSPLGEDSMSAILSFRGSPSGRFGIRVSPLTARRIAASFLAQEEEELTETQTGEVIGELANMLCGSVLSRLEKDSRFELSHPEIATSAGPSEAGAIDRVFVLEEGPLEAWLALDLSV